MKFIVGLLVFLLSVSLSFAEDNDFKKKNDQMYEPVVQINGSCSGTVFSSKYIEETKRFVTLILTAKHCTREFGVGELVMVDQPRYQDNLTYIGNSSYVGTVVLKSKSHDLAIVMLNEGSTKFKTAKIGSGNYQFGETVWAVGFPRSLSKTVTVGTLGYREYFDNKNLPPIPSGEKISTNPNEYQRSTAMIDPGSSGGPIFVKNAEGNYELIGVASMKLQGTEFIAYYVTIDAINEFLGTFTW